MRYYIIAEDLATVLIGPFNTQQDAALHVQFCVARGDSSTHEIVSETDLKHYNSDIFGLILTPAEDRETGWYN